MNIELRIATQDDFGVLKEWDNQEHVIQALGDDYDPNETWMYDQILKPSPYVQILIATLDKTPIGVVQICDPHNEETHYWGEIDQNLRALDIWIGDIKNTSKGYGQRIMELALNCCFEDLKVTSVLIDPLLTNTRAINFYNRVGFEYLETRLFNETDNCYVMMLTRDKFNQKYKDL
ncbi:MAG: GNAT family N-acetyltransferase [Patescibacteria group bacterium]